MRYATLAGALLYGFLFAAMARGETIITRDNAKADHPVTKAEFRLEPNAKSALVRTRALTAAVTPGNEKTGASLLISAWDDCRFQLMISGKPDSGEGAALTEMIVDGHSGIWWKTDSGERIQLYERGDGCLEWEIIVEAKPASNRFDFPINSENLLYFYQGELTGGEMADGALRPDSVLGSYAVYRADRGGDRIIVEGEKTLRELYGTGKAFHVYRPKAHDAAGKTVWCELSINADLTIMVPADFLESAAYPVTIDPTFGYSSAGASQTIPGTAKANINDAHTHMAGSGETITSFAVYASSGSGTQTLGLAAYTMDNGSPKLPVIRLAPASTVSLTGGTPTWYTTAAPSQVLTSGTQYCVALGDGNANTNIYYDSYGSIARSNNSTSALPATWTNGGTGNLIYSMYATYTVSGGTITPSRRRRTALALNPIMQKGDACNEALLNSANRTPVADGPLPAVSQSSNGRCEQ